MSVIQNIDVSMSEGLIVKLYMGMRLFVFVQKIVMAVFRESSIEGSTLHYSVGVFKLSVERDFLQLGMDYCPLYGVVGCSLFRGFLFYEEMIGTFKIVRYIMDIHH